MALAGCPPHPLLDPQVPRHQEVRLRGLPRQARHRLQGRHRRAHSLARRKGRLLLAQAGLLAQRLSQRRLPASDPQALSR